MDLSKPMTVVRLKVDSFKRIHAANVTPSPTGLVPVRGENAQGKSSLIEAMLAALLGRKAAQELPIMEGEAGAEVVLDLGQLVVRRHWTRDSGGKAKSSLSVQTPDGVEQRSPQAVLDALVGEFADPVAFLDQKPAEQVRTMLQVMGLGAQIATLEEDASEIYDRRRDLGRDAHRLTKAAEALTLEVDGLPAPPTEGTIEELATSLQNAEVKNAAIASGLHELNALAIRGEQIEKEIARLQEELESQRAEWKRVAVETTALGDRVDPEPIRNALIAHEEASKYAGRRELLEQTRHEAHEAQQVHATCDDELDDKREAINALLATAEFPMEGVAYDPEKQAININGIPFSQASQAERLKLAATIAMLGNPTIRVMFAREGSMLDANSQAQLAQIAEENGFQLWLEVVDSPAADGSRRSGVWIEDGEAFEHNGS